MPVPKAWLITLVIMKWDCRASDAIFTNKMNAHV